MNKKKICRSFLSLVVLILTLALSACVIVPVRTTTAIKSPTGQKAALPIEAIVPGKTTRQEVETQYKSFAVDSGVPNLFWGRFSRSSWAVFMIILAPGAGGGGGRTWGAYNLLVRFDADGTVKSSELVPDKELFRRFAVMHKEEAFPPLDLSQPKQVSGQAGYWGEVGFQLSGDGVAVTMQRSPKSDKPKPPVVMSVPLSNVLDVKIDTTNAKEASTVPLQLQFSEKTKFGKKVYFDAEPQVALTFVRWLDQVKQEKR